MLRRRISLALRLHRNGCVHWPSGSATVHGNLSTDRSGTKSRKQLHQLRRNNSRVNSTKPSSARLRMIWSIKHGSVVICYWVPMSAIRFWFLSRANAKKNVARISACRRWDLSLPMYVLIYARFVGHLRQEENSLAVLPNPLLCLLTLYDNN